MATHDNYEKNLLKALQDIAKSLRSIDSTLKTVDKDKEKTESDTPILPLNNNYKTILKLDRKLTYGDIPHELIRLFDGWQICYPNANDKIFDVVEHYGSYGHETDQIEAYGYGIDDVKGYLDVDAAFELFQNVHTERLHKEEVAKASRELDPIVNECPCKKCSDEFRMSCRGCFDYSEWISKLKGE